MPLVELLRAKRLLTIKDFVAWACVERLAWEDLGRTGEAREQLSGPADDGCDG